MTKFLEGTTAVVTGAAHGQGRTHAVRLAEAGAAVVCIDLCEPVTSVHYPTGTWEELAETAKLVEEAGAEALARKADVRDLPALEAIAAEIEELLPPVTTVVANAGISGYQRLLDVTPQEWADTIDINLRGPFHTVKAFAPGMVARKAGGSIVLISSVAGSKALPFCGHYTASKHGVQGLAKAFAQELGQSNIRVNTVNPASVRSVMTTQDESFTALLSEREEDSAWFAASFAPVLEMPEGGMLDPNMISDAVLWLASPESRYVTGAFIPVDAGVTVR